MNKKNPKTIDNTDHSFESIVGYESLVRAIAEAIREQIAYFQSPAGGSLSFDEAQKEAFSKCETSEEALKIFKFVSANPKAFDLVELGRLRKYSPELADSLWESLKKEGRKEFESGHSAANQMFPKPFMKEAWNIAKFLGLRESFIDEWKPTGGIELSLVDMLAQTFCQWQYWLEQVILRSQTEPRREHHEYVLWKQRNQRQKNARSWDEGHWFPQYVEEEHALEQAAQMADRWNRMYMRTLRQLRDLRRYSAVTINNPSQVNIASDGGQQINASLDS